MRFEVDTSGGDRIQKVLADLRESMNPDMRRQLLRKVGQIYLHYAEERFDKQNSPQRKRSNPLKESTIRIKKKKGSLRGPEFIGTWTGALGASLDFKVQGDSVFVGTDVEYARHFHFFVKKGTPEKGGPWGDIPARPFLGRNERADDRVLKMMNQFFSTDIFK